jgi:hypothetical protein
MKVRELFTINGSVKPTLEMEKDPVRFLGGVN